MALDHRTYKTPVDIKSVEHLAEELGKILGDKYEISINKKDKGIKKFFTENTTDFLTVKKNAYNAASFVVVPRQDESVETYISVQAIMPKGIASMLVDQVGAVGAIVCRMIWGNGKEFYEEIVKVMEEDFKGEEWKAPTFKESMKAVKEAFSIKNMKAAAKAMTGGSTEDLVDAAKSAVKDAAEDALNE